MASRSVETTILQCVPQPNRRPPQYPNAAHASDKHTRLAMPVITLWPRPDRQVPITLCTTLNQTPSKTPKSPDRSERVSSGCHPTRKCPPPRWPPPQTQTTDS